MSNNLKKILKKKIYKANVLSTKGNRFCTSKTMQYKKIFFSTLLFILFFMIYVFSSIKYNIVFSAPSQSPLTDLEIAAIIEMTRVFGAYNKLFLYYLLDPTTSTFSYQQVLDYFNESEGIVRNILKNHGIHDVDAFRKKLEDLILANPDTLDATMKAYAIAYINMINLYKQIILRKKTHNLMKNYVSKKRFPSL